MSFQIKEAYWACNRMDQKKSTSHNTVKIQNTVDKKIIQNVSRQKKTGHMLTHKKSK